MTALDVGIIIAAATLVVMTITALVMARRVRNNAAARDDFNPGEDIDNYDEPDDEAEPVRWWQFWKWFRRREEPDDYEPDEDDEDSEQEVDDYDDEYDSDDCDASGY